MNICALFRPLEKFAVRSEAIEFDEQTFQWVLDRLLGHVFCPGVTLTHYPNNWEGTVKEFEEPFRRIQSVTCPVWYGMEGSEGLQTSVTPVISLCEGCREVMNSLAEAIKQENIETEIIVMDDSGGGQEVYEGEISQVEIRMEEVTGEI